jgi:hypothetical protein
MRALLQCTVQIASKIVDNSYPSRPTRETALRAKTMHASRKSMKMIVYIYVK